MRAPDELGCSNLCAEWTFLDAVWTEEAFEHGLPDSEEYPIVRKSEEFIAWAQRVMRWTRQFAPASPEHGGGRMTRGVSAALAEGMQLVP